MEGWEVGGGEGCLLQQGLGLRICALRLQQLDAQPNSMPLRRRTGSGGCCCAISAGGGAWGTGPHLLRGGALAESKGLGQHAVPRACVVAANVSRQRTSISCATSPSYADSSRALVTRTISSVSAGLSDPACSC